MTELSPAAQAILNATDYPEDWATRVRVAAALRAAADQVPYLPKNCSNYDVNVQDGREEVRSLLLTIATEIEAS